MKTFLLILVSSLSVHAQKWTNLGSGTLFSSTCTPNAGVCAGVSCTSLNYVFSDQCSQRIRAWNGGFLDTGFNRFCLTMGGHSDYLGNETACVNLSNNTIADLYPPSPFNYTGSGTSPCSSIPTTSETLCDGSPASRHTYGGLVYAHSAAWMMGAGLPSGTITNVMWKLDMSSASVPASKWTQMSAHAGISWNVPICSNDPVLDQAWCIGDGSYVYSYKYGTDTWTGMNHGNLITNGPIGAGQSQGVLVGTKWIFAGGNVLGYIDLTTCNTSGCTYTDQTTASAGTCNTWINTAWPGMALDPHDGMIAMKENADNSIGILNPNTFTCTTEVAASGGPAASASSPGVFGRWQYSATESGFVAMMDYNQNGFVYQRNIDIYGNGLGASTTTCLDVDGDGYGVGPGCTGADADDFDPAVHTSVQAIAKYGSLAAFINYLGYNGSRIWILSTTGNDGICTVNGPACLTWAHVISAMSTGDTVLARAGTWSGITVVPSSGSTNLPNVFAAYPGERPFIDNRTTTEAIDFDLTSKSWVTVDGLKAAGGLGNSGCIGGGGSNTNVTIRHTETTECADGGIDAFDGLQSWLIEYNVMHDMATVLCSSCQHNLYMGSRNNPSSNITIRRNIAYNSNAYPGFQWNGRVTNLVMDQNMVFSTPGAAAFSWLEGVSNSFFRGNLAFNSSSGFQIVNYDGDCYVGSSTSGICPYAQSGNVVANNVFYVGSVDSANTSTVLPGLIVENLSTGCPAIPGVNFGWTATTPFPTNWTVLDPSNHTQKATTGGTSGGSQPSWNDSGGTTSDGSIVWTDQGLCTPTKVGNIGGNTYANNIFVNNNGGTSNYSPVSFPMCTIASEQTGGCILDTGETTLATSTFTDDIFSSTGGGTSGAISTGPNPGFGFTSHTCAGLGSLTTISGCINSDPKFVASNPSTFFNSPSSFNFRLLGSSPGIAAGTSTVSPTYDILGTLFASPPNIGAYTGSAGGCAISPATLGPYTRTQTLSQTMTATGCGAGTLTWSSSGLPTGGSGCNSVTGTTCPLSGTLSAAGTFTPTISVTDGGSNSASIHPTVIVNATPSVTTTTLPAGSVSSPYSQSVAGTNGTTPYTWALLSGSLPIGTNISSGGLISGTPSTTSGSPFTFTVRLTDSNGITADSGTLSITITGAGVFGPSQFTSSGMTLSGVH